MSDFKSTVVELFAGIGGFRLACDELELNTIWANEIDEKAAKVYTANFGDNEMKIGDIWKLYENIPKHDLLTAGFPCQPFSSAGKKQGIKDTRGTLFEVITKVIHKSKPKYFILENVKRLLTMEKGYHFATILDALAGLGYMIEWRVLNALDFGLPQNRERVIIIGTKVTNGIFSHLLTEDDADIAMQQIKYDVEAVNQWQEISKHNRSFDNWGMALNNRFIMTNFVKNRSLIKMPKLRAILETNVDKSYFFNEDSKKRIENSEIVNKYVNGVEIKYNQKGGARMGYTIFGINGVAPTLTCTTSRHYERYEINGEFRRLTNIEYARLQGFPDNHCEIDSPYNQYVLYGNAVPPQLVKWPIKRLIKNEKVNLLNKVKQMELFHG